MSHTLARWIAGLPAMLVTVLLIAPAAGAAEAPAPEPNPAEVIAYQGNVVLTQNEIDGAFSKLPGEERLNFIRDGGKVDQLIRVLLRRKAIAADAANAGFDRDPVVATRVRLEADKELAEAWLQHLLSNAPGADYLALAKEDYQAHPDEYRSPETLDVSHILIGTEDRSGKAARQLAESLEAQLREDASRFDALVIEYSDDPAKQNNAGRYRDMRRGMMAAAFEKAAFALAEPGAISEPVQTSYGWHIIRLNGRTGGELLKFDAVEEAAVARARQRYFDSYRENYLRKLLSEPIVVPPEAVEIMARRHFGENLEKAPGARP